MRTIVLGLGNILMRDDGIGVRVIETLRERELPPGVELIDAGTGVYSLIYELEDAELLIVVDAVRGGGEPGTVYRIPGDELQGFGGEALSVHDIRFPEVVSILAEQGHHPEMVVFGVEPASTEMGMELSPEVEAVLDRVADLIVSELETRTVS